MTKFSRLRRLSTFRMAALGTWGAPNDPTIYGSVDADVSEAQAFLADLTARSGVKVTLTHLVGKAVALALAERADANAIVRRGRHLYQRDSVDVFFQVAFDRGEDLSGVKVSHVDRKPLLAIASELGERVQSLRERKRDTFSGMQRALARAPAVLRKPGIAALTYLTYDLGIDLSRFGVPFDQFGSAMVTNVGMFGISRGFAPLVPMARTPIIVAVGAVEDRPRVVEGEIVVRPMVSLGVTLDHRVLDGFQASKMARRVLEVIEHPRECASGLTLG